MLELTPAFPLLIGGATTSKVHTAVKIEPGYSHPVIYVPDASRAVGVASKLLSETAHDEYVEEIKAEYQDVRERRAAKQNTRKMASLAQARKNKVPTDWAKYTSIKPNVFNEEYRQSSEADSGMPSYETINGGIVLQFDDYPLDDLIEKIDW